MNDAARPTKLRGTQLREADFHDAQLQGVNLREAELQGANLSGARLQGANLDFTRVDLSGTNFTRVDLSGANFTEADLSRVCFDGAVLKDATLKDAEFAPFQPPERPASGALSGAWRAKSLLGSVSRAVVAAVDDDDDDDDDDNDWESEEEEKLSPEGVEAKINAAVEDCLRKLVTGAPVFMRAVDKLLSKVEERNVSLLANGALKDRLSKELEKADANKAAIDDILATLVISPLLEFIRAYALPEVLCEILSELKTRVEAKLVEWEAAFRRANEGRKPTAFDKQRSRQHEELSKELSELPEAGTAVHQLAHQLLDAFKAQVLFAGKAALLKRVSPITSKCVRASARARVRREPAVDEEQALMPPELIQPGDSADCLVQELWPALRASLEAQVRDDTASMTRPI